MTTLYRVRRISDYRNWEWGAYPSTGLPPETYSLCCMMCMDALYSQGYISVDAHYHFKCGEVLRILPPLDTTLVCVQEGSYGTTFGAPRFIKFEGVR